MSILFNLLFLLFAQDFFNEDKISFSTAQEAKIIVEQNFHDDFVRYGLNIFDTKLDPVYSHKFDNFIKKFQEAKSRFEQNIYNDFVQYGYDNNDALIDDEYTSDYSKIKKNQNSFDQRKKDNKTRKYYELLNNILINKNEFYQKIPMIILKNGLKSSDEIDEVLNSIILSYLTKEIDLETAYSKTYKTLDAAIIENKNQIWFEFYKTQLESLIFIYYKLGLKDFEYIDIDLLVERLCPTSRTKKLALEKFCNENKVKLIHYSNQYSRNLRFKKTIDEIVASFNKKIGSANISLNNLDRNLNVLISGIPINDDYCSGASNPFWLFRNGVEVSNNYMSMVPNMTKQQNVKIYKKYQDIYIEKDAELRDRYKTYLEKYSELAFEDYGVLLYTNTFSGGGSKSKNYSNQQMKLINPDIGFFDFVKRMFNSSDTQAKDIIRYLSCSREHELINRAQVIDGLLELKDEIYILANKFAFNINLILESENLYKNSDGSNHLETLTLSSSFEIFRYSPLTLGRLIKNNPGFISYLEDIISQIESTIRHEKKELLTYRIIGVGALFSSIVALFYDGCSTPGVTLTILNSLMSITSSYGELLNQISLQNKTCSLQNTVTNNTNTYKNLKLEEQERFNDQVLGDFWKKYDLYKELDDEKQVNKIFLALDALTLFMDANQIARTLASYCDFIKIKTTAKTIPEFLEIIKKSPRHEKTLVNFLYKELKDVSEADAVKFLDILAKDTETLNEVMKNGFKNSGYIFKTTIYSKIIFEERFSNLYKAMFKTNKLNRISKNYKAFMRHVAAHISDDIAVNGKSIEKAIDDAYDFIKDSPADLFITMNKYDDVMEAISKYQKLLPDEEFNKIKKAFESGDTNKTHTLLDSPASKRGIGKKITLEIDVNGTLTITETYIRGKTITKNIKIISKGEEKVVASFAGDMVTVHKVLDENVYLTAEIIEVERNGKRYMRYVEPDEAKQMQKYYKNINKYCKDLKKGS